MPSESGEHRVACQGTSKCDSPGVTAALARLPIEVYCEPWSERWITPRGCRLSRERTGSACWG
jgi:hypothetical protein